MQPIKGYAPQRLLCKHIAAAWRMAALANPWRRKSARLATPPTPASLIGAPCQVPFRANVAGEAAVGGAQQDAPVGMRPVHLVPGQVPGQFGDDVRRPHLPEQRGGARPAVLPDWISQ